MSHGGIPTSIPVIPSRSDILVCWVGAAGERKLPDVYVNSLLDGVSSNHSMNPGRQYPQAHDGPQGQLTHPHSGFPQELTVATPK